MKLIRGMSYPTISDAATWLELSVSTVKRYIEDEVLPEPELIPFGIGEIYVFNETWRKEAKQRLDGLKLNHKNGRRKKHRR